MLLLSLYIYTYYLGIVLYIEYFIIDYLLLIS